MEAKKTHFKKDIFHRIGSDVAYRFKAVFSQSTTPGPAASGAGTFRNADYEASP